MTEFPYVDWLWYGFVAFAAIQLCYYLFLFLRIGAASNKQRYESKTSEPVSVIICARNERENLEKYLPQILEQKFPNFQVILVDDGSYDGTKDLLKGMKEKYDHLKIVTLEIDERYHRGKKFALTMGIKAADHDLLLLTDADCAPNSDNWIAEMTAPLNHGKDLVLGVSMFPPATNFTGWIVRVETYHTLLQYINYAFAGIPYMGVGRNIAYRKSLFFGVKGFASHQHLMSGDDDLFVNEVATKENTAVVYHDSAQTTSIPEKNFNSWHKQKLRHFSTGRFYKARHKALLGLYSTSLFLFYILGIMLLVFHFWWLPIVVVFGLRALVQLVVNIVNLVQLNATRLIWSSLFIDPIILFIQLFVGIRGMLSKPKTWN